MISIGMIIFIFSQIFIQYKSAVIYSKDFVLKRSFIWRISLNHHFSIKLKTYVLYEYFIYRDASLI